MKCESSKKILILALKIAIGTSAAMFTAQELQLQNAGSAGTIALLTILTTKWETLRLSFARIVTFGISVLLVMLIFNSFHIAWIGFGIYIFFTVLISEFLGWKSTISINSVIGAHFLMSQDYSIQFVMNEFLLVLIGTIVAFIVNMFSGNKSRKEKLVKSIEEVETTLQQIFRELASYLLRQKMKENVWQDIRNLEEKLKNLVVAAYEYEGNTFKTHTGYYMSYFEMRLEQCNVLDDLHDDLRKIRSHSVQAEQTAEYMLYLLEHVHESNVPDEQIKYLQVMVEDMKCQPLPTTREEFETRAILYHILIELEAFLGHKKRFVEELDATQRQLYWNENK